MNVSVSMCYSYQLEKVIPPTLSLFGVTIPIELTSDFVLQVHQDGFLVGAS
jgi:hypothetical protein